MGVNEDLVRRYQAGDRDALGELWTRNAGLRVRLALRYAPAMDRDDRMGEMALAFISAARKWKGIGSASFGAFLDSCVRAHFANLWHFANAQKRRGNLVVLDAAARQECGRPSVVDLVADRELQQAAIIRLKRLPKRTAAIIERRMQGESLASIGRTLGVTKAAVNKRELQAYAVLRMSDDEFERERVVRRSLGGKQRKTVTT